MKRTIALILIALAVDMSISGCENSSSADAVVFNDLDGYSLVAEGLSKSSIDNLPVEDLSQDEIDGLIFMREEEKLARDVYVYFSQKYGMRVFANISKSEETHTTAVKYLLEKYQLTDPMAVDNPGVFVNEDLQKLYTKLIEQGSISDVEALKVGALIEEVDILDLVEQIDEKVDNADIELVYSNLKYASENHLRAFVRNLSARGIKYVPLYLDQETYNGIIGN